MPFQLFSVRVFCRADPTFILNIFGAGRAWMTLTRSKTPYIINLLENFVV